MNKKELDFSETNHGNFVKPPENDEIEDNDLNTNDSTETNQSEEARQTPPPVRPHRLALKVFMLLVLAIVIFLQDVLIFQTHFPILI